MKNRHVFVVDCHEIKAGWFGTANQLNNAYILLKATVDIHSFDKLVDIEPHKKAKVSQDYKTKKLYVV